MAKSLSSEMAANVNMDAIPDRKSKNQNAALDLNVTDATRRLIQRYIGTDMDATIRSAEASEISR